MTPSLFNINEEQQRINLLLEENGGELTPEIEEALALNEENLYAKSADYCTAIKMYKAMEEAAATEIRRIQGIKKTCENAQKRMKEALVFAMNTFGIDKIEAGLDKLSLRKSESLNITDENKIPARFQKVEVSFDKVAIKAAIKAGEEIEGAEIITNKSLLIR